MDDPLYAWICVPQTMRRSRVILRRCASRQTWDKKNETISSFANTTRKETKQGKEKIREGIKERVNYKFKLANNVIKKVQIIAILHERKADKVKWIELLESKLGEEKSEVKKYSGEKKQQENNGMIGKKTWGEKYPNLKSLNGTWNQSREETKTRLKKERKPKNRKKDQKTDKNKRQKAEKKL